MWAMMQKLRVRAVDMAERWALEKERTIVDARWMVNGNGNESKLPQEVMAGR